jgi:glycosyltransferase involved in cell wall biosynthesis
MSPVHVAILMLTHNAPDFVETSIRSLRAKTAAVSYELIVVDNASEAPTRELVQALDAAGLIDVLQLSAYNSLFAEGNNMASRLASPGTTHFLLLNSDIEIKDAGWLQYLLNKHRQGITAFGAVMFEPVRADGYCLLIDADLYRAAPLDEKFQWWWAVTKQQADLLRQGYSVQAYGEHEKFIHHFGGKSGDHWKTAAGMDTPQAEVLGWFGGRHVRILDEPLLSRVKRSIKAIVKRC